jgi:alpha-1,3-rhamnosyl/mannosyltransferase
VTVLLEALGIERPGGGRSATLPLLEALFRRDPRTPYQLLLTRPEPRLAGFPNVQVRVVPLSRPLLARLWAEVALPVLARRCRVRLVHHLKNLGVLWGGVPTVITLFDLGMLTHPDLFPWLDRWYWRRVQPWVLGRARRVVVISQATAEAVQRYYGLAAERLAVIYPAHDRYFWPRPAAEVAVVRARYGLPADYLLYVGALWEKKNTGVLLQAVERLHRQGVVRAPLVLVGGFYRKGRTAPLRAAVARLERAGVVRWLGAVPDADLPALYSGARLFVFPSVIEGFGIAPLEALACGTPVVAAPVGALAECLGEACWPVTEPHDPAALSEAIAHVYHAAEVRARLRAAGLAQAARFSYDRSAAALAQLYQEVGDGR